jgi:hypothetical protein
MRGLLSSRDWIASLAAYSHACEFDGTFTAIMDMDRMGAIYLPAREVCWRAHKLASSTSGSRGLARLFTLYTRSKVISWTSDAARWPPSPPKSGRLCCRDAAAERLQNA